MKEHFKRPPSVKRFCHLNNMLIIADTPIFIEQSVNGIPEENVEPHQQRFKGLLLSNLLLFPYLFEH